MPFIIKYFEVSKAQAAEYYKLMPKSDLILLLKKFGKSDKEIKKISEEQGVADAHPYGSRPFKRKNYI